MILGSAKDFVFILIFPSLHVDDYEDIEGQMDFSFFPIFKEDTGLFITQRKSLENMMKDTNKNLYDIV